MAKRLPSVLWLITAAVMLFVPSCAANRPETKSGSTTGTEIISEQMKSQIDAQSDDYLAEIGNEAAAAALDAMRLNSLYTGSFTGPGENEVLALFKGMGAPHAAGLDRTIAAVYDAETLEIKAQTTLAADIASVYPFTGSDGKTYLLFIGDITYQGFTTYVSKLLEAKEGGWIEKQVYEFDYTDTYAYAVTNDKLHLLYLSYNNYEPVWQYLYTLYWNPGDASFTREPF